MERNEWLRNEIANWRAEGIVDEQLEATLLARYPEKKSNIAWGVILASAFGALLIGLGIIALLASNWDCLGRGARAVVSVTPALVCGIVALVASVKGWKAASLWEALGLLWCIAIAVAACLVAQTYNLGGSVPSLVLFVALLTLPVVWVTRAVGPMMFWPIFAVVWMFSYIDANYHIHTYGVALRALLLLAASVPAYVAFIRRRPPRAALVIGNFFTGLCYAIELGMILCAMPHHAEFEYCIVVFWLSSVLIGVLGWKLKLDSWPMIGVLVATGTSMPTPFADAIMLYIIGLIFSFCVIAYGVKKEKLRFANLGACLALWLILAKFFESNVEFTVKAVVLIAAGIALTTLNIVFIRHKKKKLVFNSF